jgi:cardiolipin synthase
MAGMITGLKQATKRRFPRFAAFLRYFLKRKKRYAALFITVAHVVGALTSVRAIMETRTSQGAIAWAISLNTFPYFAVPAYWVFGRTKFEGYVNKRRSGSSSASPVVDDYIRRVRDRGLVAEAPEGELLEQLAKLPSTRGNDVELLIDGEEIFPSILEGIAAAESYVLIQFYIVRNDAIGREFQEALLAASARGVKVFFVYDEIGSHALPPSYFRKLRNAGADVVPFNTMQGLGNRFQVNFRNHRKMVVVDGRTAWIGGINIGDEYNGKHETLTPWRDTLVKVAGPSVQAIQVSFLEDWFWATNQLLDLDWEPRAAASGADMAVLCLASGPADMFDTCALFFLHLINSAKERIWIASPYFVPDEQSVSALKLAALRGVDVRVLIPDKSDNRMLDLSAWASAEPLIAAGVQIYRHQAGFMHQKVFLVDQDTSIVGTANFDNRSFRLNFEITLKIRNEAFARRVEEMLLKDFASSRKVVAGELAKRSFRYRFGVRASNLLAPVQ